MIGGSRNEGDATRVEGLKTLAKELDIEVWVYDFGVIIC
jgi:hypothetical protein